MPQINRRRLNGRTAGGSSPTSLFQCTEPQLVAANGPGEIKEYFIPNPFKEDTWVTSIEIRPGNPSVVHHAIVQVPDATQSRAVSFLTAANGAAVNQVSFSTSQGIGSYSDL